MVQLAERNSLCSHPKYRLFIAMALLLLASQLQAQPPATNLGTHGYVESDGVKIHYVTAGSGPMVLLIHGFPDYWYTWREQIPELAKKYQVVAIDQRGYNLSDKPEGVENYNMTKLMSDARTVIQHFSQERAIVVGHDWGGAVAWSLAMFQPECVDRLIILNLPHPNGLRRELANNPKQQANSAYARHFQEPDAAKELTAEVLAGWVKDENAKQQYLEAFRRSSFDAMLNYYKANYPREPYSASTTPLPKVKCSVLMIHGLKDEALLPGALNDTWEWLDKDLTLVTVPNAGHFVQQDAPKLVTQIMARWLDQ